MEAKELQAVKIAAKMLVDNGLGDWHLKLKNVKTYHAQTRYKEKLITYNRLSIKLMSKDEFIGVMYHEIAHALVGPKNGHNRTFKSKYWEITGNMNFAGYATKLQLKPFSTECPSCKTIGGANNDTTKRYCRPCWIEKKEEQILRIFPNPQILVMW